MVSLIEPTVDSTSIYENGDYLERNADWHAAESPWKARHILRILAANRSAFESVDFESIAEVGCGAGRILQLMGQAFPDKVCMGFDISPQAAAPSVNP